MTRSTLILAVLTLTACGEPGPERCGEEAQRLGNCPGDAEGTDTDPRDTDLDAGDTDVEDTDAQGPADIEIAGLWADNWGGTSTITNDSWDMGFGLITLLDYDNDARTTIGENSDGTFSRFDWAWHNDGWWYCWTAFNAETEAEARDTPAADTTDPAIGGCGPFAFTQLIEPHGLIGDWTDNWEGSHTLGVYTWDMGWSSYTITRWDNDAGVIVAMQDADDDDTDAPEDAEEVWFRFDWTEHDGSTWYCTTVFDAESEQQAWDATPADATDPAASGCGASPWTELTAVTD